MLLRTEELQQIMTDGRNKRKTSGRIKNDNLINQKVVVNIAHVKQVSP